MKKHTEQLGGWRFKTWQLSDLFLIIVIPQVTLPCKPRTVFMGLVLAHCWCTVDGSLDLFFCNSHLNVDTLVSTLTRRGRHQHDRLVTLRREKQRYFSEKPTQDQRGSNPGCIDDWRGSNTLYQILIMKRYDVCSCREIGNLTAIWPLKGTLQIWNDIFCQLHISYYVWINERMD